jgi:hypothetical protein
VTLGAVADDFGWRIVYCRAHTHSPSSTFLGHLGSESEERPVEGRCGGEIRVFSTTGPRVQDTLESTYQYVLSIAANETLAMVCVDLLTLSLY